MTAVAMAGPQGPVRVRIAITSPQILAEIRQAFASRNLAVEIVRAPYVDVMVRPAAKNRITSRPASGPTARQLRATYRLNVVEVDDAPRTASSGRHEPSSPPVALSRRQQEVMVLVAQGARNPEIAARLRVSEKTVKNHINHIFRALGARSRVEAVLLWQRHQYAAANGRPPVPSQLPPAPAGTP